MSLFTRYFVSEWLRSLLASLMGLLLLVTVADIINGFLRGKEGMRVVLEWLLKMPDLSGKILPVTCLLATLFTLQRLKAHNELIAILAAGFSYLRFTWLICLCALMVVALQFMNLAYFEPFANKIKRQAITRSVEYEGKYLTRSIFEGGQFWFKSRDYFATFQSFSKKTQLIRRIQFYFFNAQGETERLMSAQRASYLGDQRWKLEGVMILDDLAGNQFPRLTRLEVEELKLNETPQDFGEFEADLTTLNWFKLKDFITKIAGTGININEYWIILHQKVALSLSCLVFALIPLGGLFRPSRRNDSFGKSVGFALLFTIGFWLLFSWALSLGQGGKIPSWLAAYIVPCCFLAFSASTLWRQRKLTF